MFKFVFVLLAALFAVNLASPAPAPVPGPVASPKPVPQLYTPYAYSGGYYASPYAYYG